jgi:hypothetical protein
MAGSGAGVGSGFESGSVNHGSANLTTRVGTGFTPF